MHVWILTRSNVLGTHNHKKTREVGRKKETVDAKIEQYVLRIKLDISLKESCRWERAKEEDEDGDTSPTNNQNIVISYRIPF
jgi:hypothetical protein